jgi:hypothetical protein
MGQLKPRLGGKSRNETRMPNPTTAQSLILAFKILVTIVGFAMVCMGCWLYRKGIGNAESDVELKTLDTSVILKNVAPGAFFALSGAVIVGIMAWNGFSVTVGAPAGKAAGEGDDPPPRWRIERTEVPPPRRE